MNTTTKVILGMAAAAAAGAAIGMLMAPEKGSELRKRVADASKDWLEELSSWMAMGKQFVADVKEQGREAVDTLEAEAHTVTEKR